MLFVTSINPRKDNYKELKSWEEIGSVCSFNAADEIESLKPRYPFINFVNSTSVTINQSKFGKYVSISEMVSYFKNYPADVMCVINSDIEVKNCFDWLNYIELAKQDKLIMGKRWNYNNSKSDAVRERWGIDCFIMNKNVASKIPIDDSYMMGRPWWDYWLPYSLKNAGVAIYKFENPIIFHKNHIQQWSIDSWVERGQCCLNTQDAYKELQKKSIVIHDDFYNNALLIDNNFSKNIYNFIEQFVKNNPIIFEFGSHQGEDTKKLASINNSYVHAFECDPNNIALLLESKLPSNVKLNCKAINSVDDDSLFIRSKSIMNTKKFNKITQDWHQSGSLKKPKNHLIKYPFVSFEEKPIEVKSITLDTYCKENSIIKIDFVWCDIQGNELEMIKGAKDSLKFIKYIYTEYANTELYEGQGTLRDIINALPNFYLLHDFGTNQAGEGNALFKNKNL